MREIIPRILVIEKDELIRNLLRDMLDDDGYQTLVTGSWLDPEDVRQLRPAVMLVDPLVDGDHGGWDYLRLLRRQPGMHSLPVIVCTANHEGLRDLTAAELALASNVILKPFDLDDLLQAITAVATSDGAAGPPLRKRDDLHTLSGSD